MTLSIIVTTDGSPASRRVLPHVAAIARAGSAKVTLLRVLNPLTDAVDVFALNQTTAIRSLESTWRAELESVLSAAGIEGAVRVEVLDRHEDVSGAILRVADEADAGLVAMHSRGSGVIRHAVLGSVAMGVLGKTRAPLLLTGQNEEAPAAAVSGRYRIVVATDQSPASDAGCLAIMPLLDECSADIALLTVWGPRDGSPTPNVEEQEIRGHLERLAKALSPGRRVAIEVRWLGVEEELADAIVRVAMNHRANAIALSTHGHSALRHVLMGSTALAVVERSHVPLLLTRYGGPG